MMAFLTVVGVITAIAWPLVSILIYLIQRSDYGNDEVWDIISYFNLVKLIRGISLLLAAPVSRPYKFIRKLIKLRNMDSIDREIWERNQSIKELEDTKDKLVELKRVKEREDKLARYIEKEKDELDFEEAEQTFQNGEWKPVNNWLICPFCGNSFMRNDDHSCEKAQEKD